MLFVLQFGVMQGSCSLAQKLAPVIVGHMLMATVSDTADSKLSLTERCIVSRDYNGMASGFLNYTFLVLQAGRRSTRPHQGADDAIADGSFVSQPESGQGPHPQRTPP